MNAVITESQTMLLDAFRRPAYRSMGQWAEEEVIIPSGQYEGRRYSLRRQPYARLWFDQVDSGNWSEMVLTGPSQSGKSLNGFVIPVCHTLFELNETVIAAVPDDDLVRIKWERDLEPVISRTRYRTLIPSKGPGSRGGRVSAMQFGNGAWLIWMTAGGSDKSRASVTSRVVCMTETDGFDVHTSTSAEANKIEQIEARTRAYPLNRRRVYKECTVTVEDGHTWDRYNQGTASVIALRCPHCRTFTSPEREHFVGWQDAESEAAAMNSSAFFCPSCGEKWDEKQRIEANATAVLVHKGQEITPEGRVTGPNPPTRTLGFRWSAVNNCLMPASDVALDEWRARESDDEDNAERKLCQFVWAVPYTPTNISEIDLTVDQVASRQSESGRGQVPDETKWITMGVDVGSRSHCHWTAIAWTESNGVVIDYGVQKVNQRVPAEIGIANALVELHGKVGVGWTQNEISCALVDARYLTDTVVPVVKGFKSNKWRAFMGLGKGQWKKDQFHDPKTTRGGNVIRMGERWYEEYAPKHRAYIVHADANFWKTWVHQRLNLEDSDAGGTLSLFASMATEHKVFAKHITAEREQMVFEKGKGFQRIWNSISSQNHWLDSTYMACVAAARCGYGAPKPKKKRTMARPVEPVEDGFHTAQWS